jgi:hypothetical protein
MATNCRAILDAARDFGPTNLLTLHMQRVLARAFAEEVEAEALANATLEARLRQSSDLEGNAALGKTGASRHLAQENGEIDPSVSRSELNVSRPR